MLYLDALDEQRSTSTNGKQILDQIRTKLDELGIPPFRLSCRAADWYGSTDVEPLKAVSANGDVLVLQLEPLSDEDIIEIASDILSDPHGFLLDAKKRDLYELLVNPQTLEMVARVVSGGKWPETRTDLYQRASEILASESNVAHMPDLGPFLTSVRAIEHAGYLCAVHLCSGTVGFSLAAAQHTDDFPFIGELQGDTAELLVSARRHLFRTDEPGRVVPTHRTVAEYLAARFIIKRVREHRLPLGRVLALITGYDGGTLSDLRGLFAWVACLCEEHSATLFARDPLGIVLYGDVAVLSSDSRRLLFENLADLASRHPWFRAENWNGHPFGAFATPDMEPVFRNLLNRPTQSSQLI